MSGAKVDIFLNGEWVGETDDCPNYVIPQGMLARPDFRSLEFILRDHPERADKQIVFRNLRILPPPSPNQ